MIKILPFAMVLAGGCTDTLDPLQRGGAADSVATAARSDQIYVALAQLDQGPTTLVSGTRASFLIAGTTPSPSSGRVERAGTGTTDGTGLAMQVSADLVAWHDGFWKTTLDGHVDIVETATYRDPADLIPISLTQHIVGELAMSGSLAPQGPYTFDLTICNRGDGKTYDAYGLSGTVNGEAAQDEVAGFDSTCVPK